MTEHPFPKTLPEGALRAADAALPDIPFDPVPRLLTAAAADSGPPKRGRKLVCRPNADARRTKDADPPVARAGRCP